MVVITRGRRAGERPVAGENTLLMMASPMADYITGQVIRVTGGIRDFRDIRIQTFMRFNRGYEADRGQGNGTVRVRCFKDRGLGS